MNAGGVFPLTVTVAIVLEVSAFKHIKKTCAETRHKSASAWGMANKSWTLLAVMQADRAQQATSSCDAAWNHLFYRIELYT